ncbi:MAG: DUF4129 domain-containing protein [Winogradskyella sp.]|uniref:DUF4129 domain-containing protein n=1 Tax=Winogradskyella sp. TaxID=1883156 RepID=UPI0025EB3915|nr:DUF4129 domain-containing protein [Winogradskyella sp.]NRB58644.1 DUF4129 domain-containing protein [Winogradskyella sp.]
MSKLKFLNIAFTVIVLFVTSTVLAIQSSIIVSEDNDPIEKRQFEDLKEKYSGNDFIYERTIENSGWWTRFKQWLADFFKDLFDFGSDAQANDAVDLMLKVFYVVIFLLVIFFIVKAIINKEGKWIFGKSSDKNIIPVTDIESNIHEADFKKLITSAEEENNYRLAIRYYYLWLLKKLSQAEIIEYDVEKTNSDYYYEITSENTKKEFSYTSYLYNYIWYGEFDIDNTQFNKAKSAFSQFLNSIKS